MTRPPTSPASGLMNRFRRLTGSNSYASELGVNPLDLLAPGTRWLDLGCGNGVAVREAARLRPDISIVALDLFAGFVDGQDLPPNLRFLQADAGGLPLRRGFDLVTAVHLLHFIEDKRSCLEAWTDLLVPRSGVLRVNWDPTDVWLGDDWASAQPLAGFPGCLAACPSWGPLVACRPSEGVNRCGVRSVQTLYRAGPLGEYPP